MAEVCVSDAFDIDGAGALGLAGWAGATVAFREVYDLSDGDTGWSGHTSLPGIELWDHSVMVDNLAPVARLAVFRITRPYYIKLVVPQPNAMQVRDGWETRVGPGAWPPHVSVAETYRGAWTAAADSGTFSNGTTRKGRIYRYFWGGTVEHQVRVPAGETAAFRWVGNIWTPPPWSNNADAGNATGDYFVSQRALTVLWVPLEDEL